NLIWFLHSDSPFLGKRKLLSAYQKASSGESLLSTIYRAFPSSMTSPYIVGPTVEARLPLGLAIEVDALYRHLNYTSTFDTCILCGSLAGSSGMTKATAGDWEFPLVVKYRFFRAKRVRPYVDMGVAGEILTNLAQTGLTQSFD